MLPEMKQECKSDVVFEFDGNGSFNGKGRDEIFESQATSPMGEVVLVGTWARDGKISGARQQVQADGTDPKLTLTGIWHEQRIAGTWVGDYV
jgi:hypothetical protein